MSADVFLAQRDRPRILYVIHARDYSGAEILQLPMMRADADALLACPAGSRTETWAHENDIATVALPFRTLRHSGGAVELLLSVPRGIATARDLRRILRRHPERTVVYGTSIRPSMIAAIAAIGLGRRVVWSLTDFLPPQRTLRTAIRLLARVGCTRAIALSHVIARDFSPNGGVLSGRTRVVHPGTPLESYATPARRIGGGRVGVVGHVSPTKRTDLAIDVAARVAPKVDAFELRVIGRAQYRDEDFSLERRLLERVEAEPGLRGRVVFDGYATDVPAALRELDVLLHCRPDEPFGMVLVEAMAAGLPVVAPASAGPLEIVEDGVTGLLYPPGEADAAARCVVRLLGDHELAAAFGYAARERCARLFSASGQLAALDRELADVAAS